MYKINNILFSDYNIHPGRQEGSTIALWGMLDMPMRLGKTSHDWQDEPGNEPYVTALEIRHAGRDITFTGIVLTDSKAEALEAVYTMYAAIGKYTGLVPLETPYGTFQVYVGQAITVERIGFGWCTVSMTFREPEPITPGVVIPEGNETEAYHIDRVPLMQLGCFVSSVSDNFSRPEPKAMNFTAWQKEGYQVTPNIDRTVTANLVFNAASYTALQDNLHTLYAMLAQPGLRIFNVDGVDRKAYNTQGFQVTGLQVGENIAVCKVQLTMIVTGVVGDIQEGVLTDNDYDPILTNEGNNIIVQ